LSGVEPSSSQAWWGICVCGGNKKALSPVAGERAIYSRNAI
jgi:hypothetical protein